MTGRKRIINALEHKEVDKIPFEMVSNDQYLIKNIKSDVSFAQYFYDNGKFSGTPYVDLEWTDMWGVKWQALEKGVKGEVKEHILKSLSDLKSLYVPFDALKRADFSKVKEQKKKDDNFIISLWHTACEPFQRMQYLRGSEQLFMDLAYDEQELYDFRDLIHSFYMKQVKMLCESEVDGIHIEDDWGSQVTTLISPYMWRKVFKPLYKDYIDLAHSYGKKVLMHSDGNILNFLPDLIDIKLDAINAQLFCMNFEKLKEFKGKIAFWGEIDRQKALPSGNRQLITNCVDKIVENLYYDKKGVVGYVPIGSDISNESVIYAYNEFIRLTK